MNERSDETGYWIAFSRIPRIGAVRGARLQAYFGSMRDAWHAGPADLRRALLSRSDAFMATATEKLLTYALGRPIRYYDMPLVRSIAGKAAANGNRFSAVLMGIIDSDAFTKRVKSS